MINSTYRLVAPRLFRIDSEEIVPSSKLIVRPNLLSICKADQRYFLGDRDPKVLADKLPMALIHEACGEVVYDPEKIYSPGDMLCLIPNLPPHNVSTAVPENYIPGATFRGSNTDGFLSEFAEIEHSRVIEINALRHFKFIAFLELVSVAIHAINTLARKARLDQKSRIGIWGDGSLGYITALLLKNMYKQCTVFVIGRNTEKLNIFSFANDVFLVNHFNKKIDHAFESVGGSKSSTAINQIIDYINPTGSIVLGGVSEFPVSINSRMVLEKGLSLLGYSRSGYHDFCDAIKVVEQNNAAQEHLESLISEVIRVSDLTGLVEAFNLDNSNSFKTVIDLYV